MTPPPSPEPSRRDEWSRQEERWEEELHGRRRLELENALARFLPTRRWFGGKARRIHAVNVGDDLRIAENDHVAHLLLVQVEYSDQSHESYALPLAFASGEKAWKIENEEPGAVMTPLRRSDGAEGILYDALWDRKFAMNLLESFVKRRRYPGERGELVATATSALEEILGSTEELPAPRVSKAEQSNTSVFYGNELILKLFRRPEPGVNPDVEIGRFLTDKAHFPHMPPVAGALEYRRRGKEPVSIAILQGYVPNEGDAWSYTLDVLDRYYERAAARGRETADEEQTVTPREHPLEALGGSPPPAVRELAGLYLERSRLLGHRTGELHLALASDAEDPRFRPEPFTDPYRRAQYQSMRSVAGRALELLREQLGGLSDGERDRAERVLALEGEIGERFAAIRDRSFTSQRIRIHGDYHLGQVLYTGEDFVIIDFEGEPARSLSERRAKTSPLRDVAGMLRSFHYACFASEARAAERIRPQDRGALERWRLLWYHWTALGFLEAYFDATSGAPFLPGEGSDEIRVLLDAYLLEKAVYELGYELDNRPQWVRIPLEGILQIMEPPSAPAAK